MTTLDLSETVYRALPGLSGSGVSKLLASPRVFHEPVEVTEAMRLGTAFHARVLGSTMPVEVSDKWQTLSGAASKVWAEDCDARSVVPVLAAWGDRLDAMEAALSRNPDAVALLGGVGVNEQKFVSEWDGVPVKGMADRVLTPPDGVAIVDLKSSRDPSEPKSLYGFGYDRQVFMYERLACEALGLEPARPPYIISVGSTAPHLCVVWQFEEWERAEAYADIDRALVLYATCVERDEWPDWNEQAVLRPRIPVWTERARETAHEAASLWLDPNYINSATETIAALQELIGDRP